MWSCRCVKICSLCIVSFDLPQNAVANELQQGNKLVQAGGEGQDAAALEISCCWPDSALPEQTKGGA